MSLALLEHELYSSTGDCFYAESSDQDNVKSLLQDSFDYQSDLTADEKAELLYSAWNTFNSIPLDDASIIRLGSQYVNKEVLFDHLSQHRVTHVFFTFDVLAHVPLAELPSLAHFLTSFLRHLLSRTCLRPMDAASISDLLMLSWWSMGFASPISYCHMSISLYDHFTECIEGLKQSQLFRQLSRYPEHANIMFVHLLRLYADVFQETSNVAEHYHVRRTKATSNEDPASRMLGVHASGSFHQLRKVYTKTLMVFDPLTTGGIRICGKKELRTSVVEVLKQAVRCSAMVDSLHQHTELPLDRTPELSFTLINRFSLIRDYLLVRACRCLASYFGMPTGTSSLDPALPNQFSCLLHGAVPKRLIIQLLSTSVSAPNALASSASSWDMRATEPANASFGPHLELICRSLDRELNVLDYASWFIHASDPKDVHLANSVLSRLIKHTPLLASDDRFCFALIVRLDRIRKAALPEQNYLKLLRSVLSHLSTTDKIHLLQLVQSEVNHTHATPLSRNPSQLESRMRLLFNRLVVSEDLIEVDKSTGSSVRHAVNQPISLPECDPEILLDCELLVLTCPLLFLTELLRLPVTRRCPASRLAVHQLLNHLSYYLPVNLGANRQLTSTIAAVEENDNESDNKQNQRPLTLFQSLLLSDLISKESTVSLISDLDIEPFVDTLWQLPDTFVLSDVLPCAFPGDPRDLQSNSGSGLLITDPIVTSIVHLFELVPLEIAPLFGCLTQCLSSPRWDPKKWRPHTERIVHILFSALWQWCFLRSAEATDSTTSHSMAILDEIISIFNLLFVSSHRELCSNRFDTDSLIAAVIRRLLQCICSVAPEMLPFGSPLMNRLIQINTSLSEKSSTDFQGLRTWLLWSEATEPIHAFLTEPQTLASIPWEESIFERQVKQLLALEHLCERFRLSMSVTSVIEESESTPPERILPRTLYFILMLAATSDSVCKSVIKASELIVKRDEQSWHPEQLTLPTILLGLFLVLRTIAQSEQPYHWGRAFYCFDRLVIAGILWIPYRWFGDREKTSGTATIYLADWTALRGSFDELSLFTDLLQLATEQKPNAITDPSDSGVLRLICNTLAVLVQRTLSVVSRFASPDRVSHLVRLQAQRLLTRLGKRLDSLYQYTTYTPQALTDLRRLRTLVLSVLDKMQTIPNT